MVGSNKGSLRFHGLGVEVAAHVASTRPALRVVN